MSHLKLFWVRLLVIAHKREAIGVAEHVAGGAGGQLRIKFTVYAFYAISLFCPLRRENFMRIGDAGFRFIAVYSSECDS